ncbi:serine/threonine protein phosphatase pp2a catalytic subunit [Theileria orientalis]|uniref:Hexose transporter 1 n=1 Tax=Theileria orientalis TaxID=68886 RepID=A0A976MBP0_THEOR|nr:serine/threonine protein phosphatase pp2a catalytic subunit [Theileria orientalis]
MSIKSCKYSSHLLISCAAAALLALAFGMGLNSLESTKEFMVADLGWCAREEQIHTCRLSVGFFRLNSIGAFIGAGIGSVALTFSHKVSRRTAMMITCFVYVLGSVILAATVHFAMLFVGRMLLGFAFGLTAVTLLFLIEICHPRWRSWFPFIFQFFVATGFLLTGLWQLIHGRIVTAKPFEITLRDKVIWRGAQLLPGIFATVAFVFLLFVSNRTPYELIERGLTEEALALIKRLYGNLDADPERGEKPNRAGDATNGATLSHEPFHVDDPVHDMLLEFERDAEPAKEHPNIFIFEALYMPDYLKTISIVFVLACGHQLVGPVFFSETAPAVFTRAMGRSYKTTGFLFTLVLVNFLVTLGVALVIRKIGRRTLMLVGTAVSTVFMFFALFMRHLGKDAKWAGALTVLGYYGFTIGYALGLGGLTYLYLAEVFPTQVRNTAFAFCVFASWTSARIVLFFMEYLWLTHPLVVHVLLLLVSAISVPHVFLFVRETKDVPLGKAYHGGGIFAFSAKRA